MYLENIVFDSVDPQRLGRFWQELLGCEFLDEDASGFETRLHIPDGPTLDLCFQRVPEAPRDPVRLHLDLLGGQEQEQVVARALALGASHKDIGQQDVPWVVLGDPEDNAFCVMEGRASYSNTGPIAALPLDSSDVRRDAGFWAWLTGWEQTALGRPGTLRHPSHRGPVLEVCPEPVAKGQEKNRLHLDLRLEAADDAEAIAKEIVRRGGTELHPNWGDLPWRVYQDPSGNEFCVLPAAGNDL
ncbi:VOC family protein [Glutamicibacter sp. AOP38-B1-38]|uniref:VOC family protein n=1 Tax=Glutamicibacter sp. AOP38-B1-38 TaxID=3457680 RepID=UPI0040338009